MSVLPTGNTDAKIMKINFSKPSRRTLIFGGLILLIVVLIFTIREVQRQQELRQRATGGIWHTEQSLTASCPAQGFGAQIEVSFTNKEPDNPLNSMNVIAKDEQTGQTVEMGTIKAGETKKASIDTHLQTIKDGTVTLLLTWSDGRVDSDTRTLTYKAVGNCTPQPPICIDIKQGSCSWDALEGATQYHVLVKDGETGTVIKEETINAPQTSTTFPAQPGKSYECSVNGKNPCFEGQSTTQNGTCPALTPTPSPTPGFCPADTVKYAVCKWDAADNAATYHVVIREEGTQKVIATKDVLAPATEYSFPAEAGKSYSCSVSPRNKCGNGPDVKSPPTECPGTIPTPTPSPIPSKTPTPTPNPSSTPSPTPPPPTGTPVPPTSTPPPTPTLVVYNTPTPPPPPVTVVTQPPITVVQRPPITVVQQPPITVVQPPRVIVQRPPVTIVQQPPQVVYVTPRPTMPATGDFNSTMVVAAAGMTLTLLGIILFFIFA